MASSITVPKEYGYVLLTAFGTVIVSYYHTFVTGHARAAAKTPYPNAYCSREEIANDKDKYIFNCAQRAHANFLEHYPAFLIGLLGSGIRYPVAASVLGSFWGVSRIMYLWGYTRRDKTKGEGRRLGRAYEPVEVVLVLLAAWTGVQMLMS